MSLLAQGYDLKWSESSGASCLASHYGKERRPDFKDPLYWLLFFFWPVLGGVLSYAYEAAGRNLNEILAINVGASGPFIIRGFATANPLGRPSIDPGEGA